MGTSWENRGDIKRSRVSIERNIQVQSTSVCSLVYEQRWIQVPRDAGNARRRKRSVRKCVAPLLVEWIQTDRSRSQVAADMDCCNYVEAYSAGGHFYQQQQQQYFCYDNSNAAYAGYDAAPISNAIEINARYNGAIPTTYPTGRLSRTHMHDSPICTPIVCSSFSFPFDITYCVVSIE